MFVKNNVTLCLVSLLNNLFYANIMLPNLTLVGLFCSASKVARQEMFTKFNWPLGLAALLKNGEK